MNNRQVINMSANVTLKDCFKKYAWDQDKAMSPEETVARVKTLLADSGIEILKQTERIDNGRLDIPVFISRCGADALEIMPTKKQMGKGATPGQAEASAVMEMVERFSFFHFARHEPFFKATYEEVRDRAMPFEQMAAAVHHDPQDLERAGKALAGLMMSWTPAFNLTRGREYLVPFNWFYEINEFNGPAAGNTLEEAVIQGMSEVVERHVCALVARNRPALPTIDLESLESQAARDLTQKYLQNGIRLHVKDFTLDMGLPTVGALAYDPATFPGASEIVFTAGTATDPEKAYIRALTEVAQLAGDFNTKSNFMASGLPKYTELSQTDYITAPSDTVPISRLPNISADNMKTEIDAAVKALADRGFEVYVINITHPVLKVPAVYTIIPGAHFRERALGSSVPFFAAKLLTSGAGSEEAAAGLSRLSSLYPEQYYLKFYTGWVFLEEGLPREAAQLLTQALKMNPPLEDLAGILTYLGLAFKEMEDYPRAIEALSRSAAVDSERMDTFNLLGFCFFKTGKHEQAIEAFKHALQIDPSSGIDYANIGVNYKALGRIDQAVEYLQTAVDLDPSLTWAREILGDLTK